MNTAELTALLNENREEARLARLMANIARRASTLFNDGYSATSRDNVTGAVHFTLLTPKGDVYGVCVETTENFGDFCTCACFAKVQTCKHVGACRLLLSEDAHLDALAQQEAEYYEESLDYPACYCYRN